MPYLVLATALIISSVAAWYSIVGLTAIFAAAKIPVIIMGASLEVGKLVAASWLYQNWERIPFLLKTYLTLAVVVLMFITSMGIFGFLSKAYIDQTIGIGDNALVIEQLDLRIAREQTRIDDVNIVISQLDEAVQTLLNNERVRGVDGAIAVRESQRDERELLNNIIDNTYNSIGELQNERLELSKEQLFIEAEVGAIRYIAELFYGDTPDRASLDVTIRWVILVIIFVFDPLAVLLLVAANISIKDNTKKITTKKVTSVFDDSWIDEDVYIDPDVDLFNEKSP